jgi:colanic acid/amylovoran biosynthesis protein
VIVVLGGDDISEYYGIIRLLDILLRLRYLKRARKKIYLLGQSIGPIHSWRVVIAKSVLRRMDKIYHRGYRSYNYVTDVLGVNNNSFLSSDLAFLDLPRQNGDFDIEKYDIQRQRYITFVPSGFWSLYCDDYMRYFEGLVNITNYLSEECKKRGMKLVLLPHVLRTSDDRSLVKQMITAGIGNENIVAVTDVLLPYEARMILGSSYFVVTQRMHGAISSLQKGVPAISLSYSEKFSEVIGSYLDLPELVVEIRKAHFGEDIDKVYSAIDRGLQDATGLKVKIEKAIMKAKRDAMIQIEDLAKDMIS